MASTFITASRMRRTALRVGASFIVLIASAGLAFALTAAEQQNLSNAEAALKRVISNLELAEQSAGGGTPTGSKAKLAGLRLNSAKADVPSVAKLLDALPAGDASVADARSRFDAVTERISALEARLTAKPAPQAPAPAAAPAAAAPAAPAAAPAPTEAGVKLDYRQEKLLSDSLFHIREVEGNAAGLAEMVERLRPVTDQRTIPYSEVGRATATIDNAARKAANARSGLDGLPADGRGVADARNRLAAAETSIASSRTFLDPLAEKLGALVNPASYPNLDTDVARVQELAGMFADVNAFNTDKERAAQIAKETDAAKAEVERVQTAYAPLIGQQTAEGKRIGGVCNFFMQKHAGFVRAADAQRAALPGQIDADLAEVSRMADQAVTEQRPMWFTGGIPQRLGWLEEKMVLLESLDPKSAPNYRAKVTNLERDLAKKQSGLRDLIIDQNPLPPDRYFGADKAALSDASIAAWREREPSAEVLAVRFPSEAWKREKIWRNQTGDWYFIDRSKIQAQLIVKQDANLAVVRPINIWKDHLKGDTIKYFPLHDEGEELQPQSFIKVDKVK